MRFSLRTALLATAVVAATLGAFGPGGLVLILVALYLLWWVVWLVNACSKRPWNAAAVVRAALTPAFVAMVVALLLPHYSRAGPKAWQAQCRNNMKQISLGLYNYHDTFGCFPPAYIVDAQGKPMHSWRVLILPYVDAKSVYDQYDFAEPWNGPNNRKLAAQMPYVYRCPDQDSAFSAGRTSYVAVTGPRTCWIGEKSVRLKADAQLRVVSPRTLTPNPSPASGRGEISSHDRKEITDRLDQTILLVETVDASVNWMEPRDLTWEEAAKGINAKAGRSISSRHSEQTGYFYRKEGWAHALMADGSVLLLPDDLPQSTLRAMLTIDDGAPTAAQLTVRPQVDHAKWLALAAWLASIALFTVSIRSDVRHARNPMQ